jgi:hypothetical protein
MGLLAWFRHRWHDIHSSHPTPLFFDDCDALDEIIREGERDSGLRGSVSFVVDLEDEE